jgi:WD40 repeat protein/tRNA A-37 threonylcarbamoyl transferase component Bud32
MPALSLTAFTDTLRQLHLLDDAQLGVVRDKLLPRLADQHALTQELLRRGWLTPYQADLLALGQGASLLLGSYVLLERLGEGGMGQVFKARNWKLGQIVALKLVRTDRAESETVLRRFRREVAAASKMHHPHVVRALDADEVGGTCLLAMEYIDGPDFARLLRERGPLPVRLACDCVRQAALGLQHAHERGVVHRDVKPHNLLLGRDGRVRLLDLGVARVRTAVEASGTLTMMGALLGTPDYIAPEQAMDSRSADIRSDLYSLGATFYQLLTGQTPFGGSSVTERLLRHQLDPVPDPSALRPEVPAEVSAVVQKLLAKRPDDRYQTPADLAAALATLLSKPDAPPGARVSRPLIDRRKAGGTPALPPGDAAAIVTWAGISAETADDRPAPGRAARRAPASRWFWYAIAASFGVLLVLVAALVIVVATYGDRPGARATEAPGRRPPTVAVSASGDWQDTGVDLIDGERFLLTPSGRWRKGDKECDDAGLTDAPRDRAILPTAPLLALLVRVGDEPYPQAASREAMHAPRAGRLYLRANDLDRAGNGGSLQVTVGGGSRSARQPPAPGPCLSEAADAALAPLRPKGANPDADPEGLRQELAAFRRQYAGAPQVGEANAMLAAALARLPSPFDRLRRADAPGADLRAAGEAGDPKGLARVVAVYGDGRLRHWAPVSATLISPDGTRVASASGTDVVVWNLATGRSVRRLRTNCGAVVRPCAFSPDGSRLALAGDANVVEVWDLQTGKTAARADCKQGAVAWVDVSPDGQRLATAGADGTVKVWDATLKGPPAVLKGHTGKVWQVAFAAGGTLVSAGQDGTVRLWDLETGKAQTFEGHNGVVSHAELTPDGKTLVAASTAFLRVWDVAKHTFTDLPNGCVGRLALLDGGRTLAVHYGSAVQCWDLAKLADKKPSRTLPLLGSTGTHISFSPDGQRVAFAAGHEVHVQDATKTVAEEVPLVPPREHVIQSAAVSPDGRFLALADGKNWIDLIDLATGRPRAPSKDYSPVEPYHFGLAFGPEGTPLFERGYEGGGVVRWRDTESGAVEKTCSAKAACYTIASAPDGKALACGLTGGNVELIDVASGKTLRSLGQASGVVQALSFSPDGRVLAVGCTSAAGGNPLLYDVASGTEVRYTALAKAAYGYPAFSPDGRLLAVSAPGVAGKLVSATTGKEVGALPVGGPVAFRPDGKVLAIPHAGTVDLWDVAAGKVTESLRIGPPGGVVVPSFTPDGRHLVTLNGNGTVYVLRLSPAP